MLTLHIGDTIQAKPRTGGSVTFTVLNIWLFTLGDEVATTILGKHTVTDIQGGSTAQEITLTPNDLGRWLKKLVWEKVQL